MPAFMPAFSADAAYGCDSTAAGLNPFGRIRDPTPPHYSDPSHRNENHALSAFTNRSLSDFDLLRQIYNGKVPLLMDERRGVRCARLRGMTVIRTLLIYADAKILGLVGSVREKP
jgi:hypothetical protein